MFYLKLFFHYHQNSHGIVGYIKSTVFARIQWRAEATAWDKFREYYIRTFNYNLLPALIVAIIFTMIFIATVCLVNRKKS